MNVPRVRFVGDEHARMVSNIFTETLQDLRDKFEDGSGAFPAGFLHTSTLPHEGTCYYDQMWGRDCGRGIIELAALGFGEEALPVSRYFLTHITLGDHWAREIHNAGSGSHELDGNMMILLALFNTWTANDCEQGIGIEFLDGLAPVIDWVLKGMQASPYGGLLPSESELSGNPFTPTYVVYPIYGNYGMLVALSALAKMAGACGRGEAAEKLSSMCERMKKALLERLVSDGKYSYAPQGCWVNAIDGRDGHAYDLSDWVGSSWPVYHWTRQLPFIFHPDHDGFPCDSTLESVHANSYADVQKWMCTGEYFRKYGFVSNSGWTGMAGRHDDTMCGYGQDFFIQAALLEDDINTYTKCLEGIARLGYDGSVVEPLAFEMNPWVVHECFNFENYDQGRDHTFGAISSGRREVMDNPGDEGNLVQEAEIIKAIRLVVGVGAAGQRLVITPRLPWMWDSVEVMDYPVRCGARVERISFRLCHERWRRKCTVTYDIPPCFDGVDVRFGPFASHLFGAKNMDFEVEKCKNGSWIWVQGLKPGASAFSLCL